MPQFEFQEYMSTHLISSYVHRLFNIHSKHKLKIKEHYSCFWKRWIEVQQVIFTLKEVTVDKLKKVNFLINLYCRSQHNLYSET